MTMPHPKRYILGTLTACLAAAVLLCATSAQATPPTLPGLAWPSEGVTLAPQPGDQTLGDILGDGRGGAFVAWIDPQAGPNDHNVFLQRVDGTGRIAWQDYRTTGVPVCTAPGRQFIGEWTASPCC